ncbi:hypothetical protein A2Z00_05315 [Candidatus Gottesmanbacteria bacterium RBG_13_45_10]|uniref:ABC transporter domain-containing protein n=1 Tax=Candidatus Gottesmanbacteria bacterium RBG_13_45_10 TaxID=1798370 RepID=A0A1F5ZI21_9BACT|nr:MAG: hypothetical protein A2Z00_05315 [Candidatus Gottesmanbacteria bacterium RBG_13_45_10]
MNAKTLTAIELTNISKRYVIHHEKPTLAEKFIKGREETFWALKDITIAIHKGEKVGIIGLNGSGKTTLLKIIAGISSPTSGTIKTYGKVVSLIDLEAGFHDDLTGIENIFLNGMLLGMSTQEIKAKLKKIIAFANIGRFVDVPLFTYSQGMKLRLGFSVAIHADPDTLILDEGLGAGDIDFQKRAQDVILNFFRQRKTILVVTQLLYFIRKNCKRVILLDHGEKIIDGGLNIIKTYEQISAKPANR